MSVTFISSSLVGGQKMAWNHVAVERTQLCDRLLVHVIPSAGRVYEFHSDVYGKPTSH